MATTKNTKNSSAKIDFIKAFVMNVETLENTFRTNMVEAINVTNTVKIQKIEGITNGFVTGINELNRVLKDTRETLTEVCNAYIKIEESGSMGTGFADAFRSSKSKLEGLQLPVYEELKAGYTGLEENWTSQSKEQYMKSVANIMQARYRFIENLMIATKKYGEADTIELYKALGKKFEANTNEFVHLKKECTNEIEGFEEALEKAQKTINELFAAIKTGNIRANSTKRMKARA